MDNYFSSPDLFNDLVMKKNLLLWHCPTQQKGHAT